MKTTITLNSLAGRSLAAFALSLVVSTSALSSVAQAPTPKDAQAGPAHSQSLKTSATPVENVPEVLANIISENDIVRARFETEVPGVTGFLVEIGGDPRSPAVAYTFDNKTAMLGGLLIIDEKGVLVDLSARHLDIYAQHPDYDASWSRLEEALYIQDGPSGAEHIIYGFFDPNCVYCHLAWKMARPYVQAGLQIRWVPVALLSSSSAPKIAAILDSDDPAHALHEGNTGWSANPDKASDAFAQSSPSPALLAKLKENALLFVELGKQGTPVFVYKNKEGQVRTINGLKNRRIFSQMTDMPYLTDDDDPAFAQTPR